MKGSEEKNGIPAAALAGLARTAAGAGWPGILVVSAAAALLRRLRGNACVPRWLRAVQALFGAFVLCQALTWAGASWQGAGNGMWIGLILLALALWLAHKGAEAVQAASGVLGLAEAGLLAAVILGSLRQIRPENLLPGVGLPDGWLLVALLLPGGGWRQGWLPNGSGCGLGRGECVFALEPQCFRDGFRPAAGKSGCGRTGAGLFPDDDAAALPGAPGGPHLVRCIGRSPFSGRIPHKWLACGPVRGDGMVFPADNV